MPPQNAPSDAAEPAEHNASIHDDDVFQPDIGMERIVWREQPAGERGDADAEREGDAMGEIDIDAHVSRSRRDYPPRHAMPCQGACWRSALTSAADDDSDEQRSDCAGLVDENLDEIVP